MSAQSTDQPAEATGTATSTIRSKWWYWIAAQPVIFVLFWTLVLSDMLGYALLTFLLMALVWFVGVFAYVADAKAISRVDAVEWHPSGFAYGGLSVFFGWIIAPFYLYMRHKHVGTP